MGTASSKAQSLKAAIERQDINAVKAIIRDSTSEQVTLLCKSLVPGNDHQCTMLHYAAWQDSKDLLAVLLDYADDLEVRDGLGWTLLMTAVQRGSKDNVQLLLERGAKVDCDSVRGMNLLATAMSFHQIDLIKMLLDHGAQLAHVEDHAGCYLLHFAVDEGLTDIVKLFLDRKTIPIDTVNERGWSPLHLAAGHNHVDLVKLLIDRGASVNIQDYDGNTPLAWARAMDAQEVMEELEKHGATTDEQWHGDLLQLGSLDEKIDEGKAQYAFENSQFEIEESKGDESVKVRDALQCATDKSVC